MKRKCNVVSILDYILGILYKIFLIVSVKITDSWRCKDPREKQTRVDFRLKTKPYKRKEMLSKTMTNDVTEKRSVTRVSRNKQTLETQKPVDKTFKSNEEQNVKNGSTGRSSGISSNWEKFRSVVSQPNSTTKNPKRQHLRPTESWHGKRKAPRMVLPDVPGSSEKGEQPCAENEKLNPDKELTKQIAMDCEMVGIGDGTDSMLARVSLVNRHGICVYDKYVKPTEKIQDYRTAVSGIRPHHLLDGEDFKVVQSEVSDILRGRLLIGHALKNDLSVLFLSHPKRHLRDTSRYKPFRKVAMGNTPSLKKLAAELLGVKIQTGEHNSVEDARTAMQLYVLYKNQWEADVHSR